MTSAAYDVIVIGAGLNGMTCAALLAKQGKKVLIVEQREQVGGMASGYEFHPGFRSASLTQEVSTFRKHLLDRLQLQKYGLEVEENSRAPLHFFDSSFGGSGGIALTSNLNQTLEGMSGALSSHDIHAYEQVERFNQRIFPWINHLVEETLPDLRSLSIKDLYSLFKKAVGLRLLGEQDMMEILRVAPMCVADYLNENFEHDAFKAALSIPALRGHFAGPWSPGTVAPYLLWQAGAQVNIQGGARALALALEKSAQDLGVEIRCNEKVEEILVSDQKLKGIRLQSKEELTCSKLVSSLDPHKTFLELIHPRQISQKLASRVSHWRMRGSTTQLNLAFHKKVRFKGLSTSPEYIRIAGPHLDHVEKQFDPIKYQSFATEPVLEIHRPTERHEDLAPAQSDVLSVLVHFTSYDLREAQHQGWSKAAREAVQDAAWKQLSPYLENSSDDLAAWDILSPPDLETRYGVTGGHLLHGEPGLDQLLMRPTPETMRYLTPIEGLALCGQASFPGGSICCGPGSLAASILLKK